MQVAVGRIGQYGAKAPKKDACGLYKKVAYQVAIYECNGAKKAEKEGNKSEE